jgi:hypothetical protein
VDEQLFLCTNIRLRHQRNKTPVGRIVPSHLIGHYNGAVRIDPLKTLLVKESQRGVYCGNLWSENPCCCASRRSHQPPRFIRFQYLANTMGLPAARWPCDHPILEIYDLWDGGNLSGGSSLDDDRLH